MSLEVIKPPSKEVQDKVRNAFGLSEETIRDSIEQLREWLEYQPHLPKEIGTFSISV
jgi:transcriptional antiterminator